MRILDLSDIKAMKEVRLVGKEGNAIVPAEEAWRQAENQGLDLILVSAEDTVPPVVRVLDYKKIMFERKKSKATKKQQKKRKSDLKEIQLKANISDHDLQTKINNIDRFLERGDKVKIIVRLKGRERDNPKRAHDLIDKVVDAIKTENKANKLAGPVATVLLEPTSSK